MAAVDGLVAALKGAGVRSKVDANELKTPGWRYNYWELKGVRLGGGLGLGFRFRLGLGVLRCTGWGRGAVQGLLLRFPRLFSSPSSSSVCFLFATAVYARRCRCVLRLVPVMWSRALA